MLAEAPDLADVGAERASRTAMHDAFHISSTPVVSDIKERVESVLLHGALMPAQLHLTTVTADGADAPVPRPCPTGNKLYIGCQTGTLHIYTLNDNDDTQSSTTASEVAGASKGASGKSE